MWPEQHFSTVPHYRYNRSGFETLPGTTDFLSTPIHTRLRPTQPPVKWVLGILPRVRLPTPSSTKVKNKYSYISTPPPHSAPGWHVMERHINKISKEIYQLDANNFTMILFS